MIIHGDLRSHPCDRNPDKTPDCTPDTRMGDINPC
jgi:hypothetical protein